MATDNKDIQNQKVFVKLCSTLEVQAKLHALDEGWPRRHNPRRSLSARHGLRHQDFGLADRHRQVSLTFATGAADLTRCFHYDDCEVMLMACCSREVVHRCST